MLVFIVRRLLSAIALLAGITVLAFFLLNLASGDVPRKILGEAAGAEQVALKAHELGLDKPIFERFFEWIAAASHGDLGRSWFTGEPVIEAVLSRVSVTLSLIIGTIIVAAIAAVILGVTSAIKRGWVDKLVQGLGVIGFALPSFLIALALVTLIAIQLRWLPATGYTPITQSFSGWIATITLPVIALAIDVVASLAQQVRGSMIDVLRRDYIRTLQSRGLSPFSVVFRHGLRNAAGPALTVLSLKFIGLLGAAVIIEQVFALPGLGQIAVLATANGDTPIVMGVILVTATLVVTVNLIIDLLQAWLNPKVRLS